MREGMCGKGWCVWGCGRVCVCVVREGVYGYSHGCIVKVCMFVVRVRECVVVCGGVCGYGWGREGVKWQDQTEPCVEGHGMNTFHKHCYYSLLFIGDLSYSAYPTSARIKLHFCSGLLMLSSATLSGVRRMRSWIH